MARNNETVAEIVCEMHRLSRATNRNGLNVKDDPLRTVRKSASAAVHMYANRIETAHKREVAAKDGERKGLLKANESLANDNTRLRGEIAELRECLKEAITEYCTSRPHEFDDGFGNCGNFKNGSCACPECWRLDCINKWRKALEGVNNGTKR